MVIKKLLGRTGIFFYVRMERNVCKFVSQLYVGCVCNNFCGLILGAASFDQVLFQLPGGLPLVVNAKIKQRTTV